MLIYILPCSSSFAFVFWPGGKLLNLRQTKISAFRWPKKESSLIGLKLLSRNMIEAND